jgi:hypothetical protein
MQQHVLLVASRPPGVSARLEGISQSDDRDVGADKLH